MVNRLSSVCLLAVLSAACADKIINPTPATGAPLAASRKYLEGRWNLESFEIFPPGRSSIRLAGTGLLTYDDFSNLRIEIRADDQTAAVMEQAGIVIKDGVISSNGRAVVNMQNRTLSYVIEGQPAGFDATGPLSLTRPRHWVVDGNVLTLTTRDADGKALSVSRWRKQP